jgi:predicted SAM-dependent methyltransferase
MVKKRSKAQGVEGKVPQKAAKVDSPSLPSADLPHDLKLDIGCGLHYKEPLEEWVHLDINPGPHIEIEADFGAIPLPDGSVAEIYLGDVIEHVPLWRQKEVLAEWRRILKPGGIIAGRTPNLDRAMRDYAEGSLSFRDAWQSIYGWGDRPTEMHFTTFTKETLTQLFAENGFKVEDYSGSPGSVDRPWWLVFTGIRL